MIRYVNVQLNPTGFTYDVFSGTSPNSITDLVCNDVTVSCDFAISNTLTASTIYIKLVTKDCLEQIIEVYIGPPDCSFGIHVIPVIANVWRPELLCERENSFAIRKTITGISSPSTVWYDSQTKRVYVADVDYDPNNPNSGNVYWFDPVTARTVNDVTFYTGNSLTGEGRLRYNALQNSYIDTVYRRIYFVGTDTIFRDGNDPSYNYSGFTVYDIDSNTHRLVLSYGSYTKFQRDFLYVNDQYIYLNDLTNNSFIRLNRSNLSGRLDIPLTYLAGDPVRTLIRQRYLEQTPQIIQVGNFLWLVSTGTGRVDPPSIPTTSGVGIFDTSFNFIREITLPNPRTFNSGYSNCCFYWQSIFYDSTSNKVFVNDHGSSQRFVIQPNGTYDNGTIIFNESLSGISESRYYVAAGWTKDPTNDNLYQNVTCLNSLRFNNRIKYKAYLIDRSNYSYLKLFDNRLITSLSSVDDGLSNSVMGSNRGLVWLNNLDPIGGFYYNDGAITIYNNTISGSTTGNVIVNQLVEYDSYTNLPTGNVKPNDPNDPDYVPSPYFDTNPISGCPIDYTLNCPSITTGITSSPFVPNNYWFELNLETATRRNPIISAFTVTCRYHTSSNIAGTFSFPTPLSSNYLTGRIPPPLSENTIDVIVQFISTGGTIINTCNY